MTKQETAPTPMDPSVREDKTGAASANTARVCYAAKTLVAEVHELFPETPVEYSNYDGRNTALDVTFDLSMLDIEESDNLAGTLQLLVSDSRVSHVLIEGESNEPSARAGQALVSFKASPRTQDSREPFGLADAYVVMAEGSL